MIKLLEIGHYFADIHELITKAVELLEVNDSLISEAINNMLLADDLILDKNAVYLHIFYYSELGTAKRIHSLMTSQRNIYFSGNDITFNAPVDYNETQFKAIPDNMTLILVGDADQLPSIGPGKVLSDIIASGGVPVIKLEHIFRQARRSSIINSAYKINKGLMPYLTDHDSDFLFVEKDDSEQATEFIIRLYCCFMQDFETDNVQLLSPMRRGELDTDNLNQLLQAEFYPSSIGLKVAGFEFRLGDIGIVCDVNTDDRELTVRFDDNHVVYDSSELDELVLAYATTIHKAQGCEFPYVIMPLVRK